MQMQPKACFTYRGWSYCVETPIFELPKVKNCISRLYTGPFTTPFLVETVISHL